MEDEAGVGRAGENSPVAAKERWGSCELVLEPDFQTLSIKLATAVMVHRAEALRIGNVCVLYVRDWIRATQFVCARLCSLV